ncbi:MAG TPA: Uma2 family endonuclease [Gammaproteobacteria bacterium]|nr:Uma2 family endonuclease [Gammaproteobacteria bacterium]
MSTVMQEWPRRHRITVEHYYRMAEAGLFEEDERVELINGEIIDMPPMGSRHAGTVAQLTDVLSHAVGGRAMIRAQLPVRLSDDSEPEPDIAVVKLRSDYYKSNHPVAADILLLVEISDTTVRYDRQVKVPLYAQRGIPEVWIVDLQSGEMHFYRSPVNGKYTVASSTAEPGVVSIASLPSVKVDLSQPRI